MASRKPDVFTQLRLLETGGAKAVTSLSLEDELDEKIRLNPAQRKIRAARIQHEKAVKALLARNENARELALDGVEALRQAEVHDAETDAARKDADVRPPSSAVSELAAAESAGLEKAYKMAMSLEAADAPDLERLKAWQLVFAVAQTLLEKHPEGNEAAYRAQMTSLMRQSILHEEKGLVKHAIAALERLVDIAPLLKKADLATISHLIAVAQRIVRLATSIGSIDRIRRFSLLASGLSKKHNLPIPSSSDPAVAAPPKAVLAAQKALDDAAEEDAKEEQRKKMEEEEAKKKAAAAAAAASAAASAAAAAKAPKEDKKKKGGDEKKGKKEEDTSKKAAPTAPATPAWPTYEASDSSPKAQFARLMSSALFEQDFEPMKQALNKSLLGDAAALTMLKTGAVEPFGITALMACASSGKDDLVRRLLALWPSEGDNSASRHVIAAKDTSGNNAIAHALNLAQQKALHELLLVAAKDPKVQEAAPKATPASLLPLSLVGLTIKHASDAPPASQQQLRAFCGQPLRYVAEYRPPLMTPVAAASAMPATTTMMTTMAAPVVMPPMLLFAWAQAQAAQAATLYSAAAAAATTAASLSSAPVSAPAAVSASSSSAPAAAGSSSSSGAKPPSNVSLEAREGKLAGRDLKPFFAGGGDGGALGGLEEDDEVKGKGKGGKGKGKGAASSTPFDQFALNEQKFGAKAKEAYRPDLYTTKLDMSSFTAEQIAKANALADEIETEASAGGGEFADNPHMKEERGVKAAAGAGAGAGAEDEDEEAKFSAVSRTKKAGGKVATKDTFTDAGVAAGISDGAAGGAGDKRKQQQQKKK